MKIEYGANQDKITATTTDQTPWTLTLTAKGNYKEIEWLKKRIGEIGKK